MTIGTTRITSRNFTPIATHSFRTSEEWWEILDSAQVGSEAVVARDTFAETHVDRQEAHVTLV